MSKNYYYTPLIRTETYRNEDFLNKLLSKFDINHKVITKIAIDLMKILSPRLKYILSPPNTKYVIKPKETHTGIYLTYPDFFTKSFVGDEFVVSDFHLSLHKVKEEKMINKAHFTFKFKGYEYRYPLMQIGNLLTKKTPTLKGSNTKNYIIYNDSNTDINNIIKITLETIKETLDKIDIEKEKKNRAERNIKNMKLRKAIENKKAEEIKRKQQENEARRVKLSENFERKIRNNIGDPINNNSNKHNFRKEKEWGLSKEKIEERRKSFKKNNGTKYKISNGTENKISNSYIDRFKEDPQKNNSSSESTKYNNILGKRIRENNNKNGGSKEKNKLNSIKTKYLLEYCKKNKLKGYSEYNKKDLINFIKNNVTKKLT
jgi:hypothetical protein